MFLFRQVQKFLNEYWDQKSPLLLGYSGGPDSKALLYLLLELGVRPHLAHVDHGWREESALEAQELKKEADFLNLPFHMIRLDPDRRESVAREKRLSFFSSLFQKIPFQALLLAHQADDGSETVLKRVLEGAHLVYLGGMKPVSTLQGLSIWRPLLSAPRSEVLAYLEKKELSSIDDKTNGDPSYLRARMRVDILPTLARSFGKEISGNLALLGQRSLELQEYLDRKTDPFLAQLRKGPFGWVLPPGPSELLEMRHLLQRLGLSFSRFVLEGLADALIRKQPNRVFGPRLIADRGYFFIWQKKCLVLPNLFCSKRGFLIQEIGALRSLPQGDPPLLGSIYFLATPLFLFLWAAARSKCPKMAFLLQLKSFINKKFQPFYAPMFLISINKRVERSICSV
jgi:tRNA(Ile)-lysidine synthetase, N-terminal domain